MRARFHVQGARRLLPRRHPQLWTRGDKRCGRRPRGVNRLGRRSSKRTPGEIVSITIAENIAATRGARTSSWHHARASQTRPRARGGRRQLSHQRAGPVDRRAARDGHPVVAITCPCHNDRAPSTFGVTPRPFPGANRYLLLRWCWRSRRRCRSREFVICRRSACFRLRSRPRAAGGDSREGNASAAPTCARTPVLPRAGRAVASVEA